MNSDKIKNLVTRLRKLYNIRIVKMLLFSLGALGFLYALGGAMKILTYTVLAFKGLVRAFMA
jgi:uncharacterized alpha/beta hydrolase family protein